ncbi:MAG TPA: sigma factor-like helix-turn-helix DNA-binding protein [Eubacteriales bacterium]|jgi:predicted DNA-binding protein YlxM (UPF0122 family)|nr:sigma factor-like helix-turn-helix DNA-binding protein [Clostridia bacterium]HRR89732.1 sigma factor-like helix-turn-helix DNA-binding protein [Eubacteriales bacterium]HRU84008.1 sigma factor-like helix-turn-helix DNA-binding protein [Eubacteriales bacterium]
MLEKTLEMGKLIDVYGKLLTPHQAELIDLYYNKDISLFEIAEIFNISRQAARDAIVRGERQLKDYESKLGLIKSQEMVLSLIERGKAASEGEKNAYFDNIAAELFGKEEEYGAV